MPNGLRDFCFVWTVVTLLVGIFFGVSRAIIWVRDTEAWRESAEQRIISIEERMDNAEEQMRDYRTLMPPEYYETTVYRYDF